MYGFHLNEMKFKFLLTILNHIFAESEIPVDN